MIKEIMRCKHCNKPIKYPKANKTGYCSNCARDSPKAREKSREYAKRWRAKNPDYNKKYYREIVK